MGEVLAEEADASYSSADVLVALKIVCKPLYTVLEEGPDPAEDPPG